jgi:3-hydroxyisobutyrate dehydrogenase
MRTAFIGLGRMGGSMADHALRAGHSVAAFDVRSEALEPRVALGARRATSPRDAACGAELACITVLDDAQLEEVMLGPDGILASEPAPAVIAVHSTVRVDTIRRLASEASALESALLDAGISGGVQGAERGDLYLMVGGPADALERARPVLASYAREIAHLGASGTGMAAKLARNLIGHTALVAAHEGVAIAEGAGVDLAVFQEIFTETETAEMLLMPFKFGSTRTRGDHEIPGFGPARAFAEIAVKDLGQALELARELGIRAPTATAARGNASAAYLLDDD